MKFFQLFTIGLPPTYTPCLQVGNHEHNLVFLDLYIYNFFHIFLSKGVKIINYNHLWIKVTYFHHRRPVNTQEKLKICCFRNCLFWWNLFFCQQNSLSSGCYRLPLRRGYTSVRSHIKAENHSFLKWYGLCMCSSQSPSKNVYCLLFMFIVHTKISTDRRKTPILCIVWGWMIFHYSGNLILIYFEYWLSSVSQK